jgi:hypothetical protein
MAASVAMHLRTPETFTPFCAAIVMGLPAADANVGIVTATVKINCSPASRLTEPGNTTRLISLFDPAVLSPFIAEEPVPPVIRIPASVYVTDPVSAGNSSLMLYTMLPEFESQEMPLPVKDGVESNLTALANAVSVVWTGVVPLPTAIEDFAP